jgi:hypothetical protein
MIKSRLLSLFLLMVFTNQPRIAANRINALPLMFKPETTQIAKTQTTKIVASVANPLTVQPAAYAASSSPVPRITSALAVLFRQWDIADS